MKTLRLGGFSVLLLVLFFQCLPPTATEVPALPPPEEIPTEAPVATPAPVHTKEPTPTDTPAAPAPSSTPVPPTPTVDPGLGDDYAFVQCLIQEVGPILARFGVMMGEASEMMTLEDWGTACQYADEMKSEIDAMDSALRACPEPSSILLDGARQYYLDAFGEMNLGTDAFIRACDASDPTVQLIYILQVNEHWQEANRLLQNAAAILDVYSPE